MPRRSPPSSLRLVQGPVPPRSYVGCVLRLVTPADDNRVPKFGHTLPSVPRPTFSQPAMVVRGPAPRQQASRQESDHTRIQTPIAVEEMLTPLEPVASTL
ncbi:hypothetical protein C8F01DRAFT_1100209 [Mycena amicta]|nr:hypothetical protein C8F01DRAFT_1100209 [Mycena amicta]